MRRAGRLHGCRLAAACVLVAAFLAGALVMHEHTSGWRQARGPTALVGQLLVADIAELPEVVASLEREPSLVAGDWRPWPTIPIVLARSVSGRAYALAARPGVAASRLIEFAPSSDPRELAAIRDRLAPYAPAPEGPALGRGGSRVVDPGLAAPHRDAARGRRRRQRSVARLRASRHE